MAVRKNAVQLQVAVTLSPQAYEFLEKNARDGDLANTLSAWASYYVDQQSRGGLFLEPNDHDYLADLSPEKKRFRDSRSLVRAVEKGLNRRDSQFSFVINVDPAHIQPLTEHASAVGLSIEEAIDGIVQMIFASGWIYDFTPDQGRSIPFTFNMLQATAALCEKQKIDSSDIAGLIAEERFMPMTREMKKKAQALCPDKLDFTATDLDGLLDELAVLRKQVAELRVAPRELVTV